MENKILRVDMLECWNLQIYLTTPKEYFPTNVLINNVFRISNFLRFRN
jgi:hypothetical protein